jgi:hypothetical protein
VIFNSPRDAQSEAELAGLIEAHWRCHCVYLGKLCPVEWNIFIDNRLVAIAELKTRYTRSDAYDDYYLAFRKWTALTLVKCGLLVPAYVFYRWTANNVVVGNDLCAVACDRVLVAGRNDRPGVEHDREPIVLLNRLQLLPLHRLPCPTPHHYTHT